MRSKEEWLKKLAQYEGIQYIYDKRHGLIAWQVSTGGNVEPMFIEAVELGKGHGLELYRMMCRHLLSLGKEPYHSCFGYRLASNTMAARFYDKMGWNQVDIGHSIYKGDSTVIMWIKWTDLLINLEIQTTEGKRA